MKIGRLLILVSGHTASNLSSLVIEKGVAVDYFPPTKSHSDVVFY